MIQPSRDGVRKSKSAVPITIIHFVRVIPLPVVREPVHYSVALVQEQAHEQIRKSIELPDKTDSTLDRELGAPGNVERIDREPIPFGHTFHELLAILTQLCPPRR